MRATASRAYKDFEDEATDWLRAHPEANPTESLKVMATGFSRGGGTAAIFSQLLYERGLTDPQTGKTLIPPGQLGLAGAMIYDPVTTGAYGLQAAVRQLAGPAGNTWLPPAPAAEEGTDAPPAENDTLADGNFARIARLLQAGIEGNDPVRVAAARERCHGLLDQRRQTGFRLRERAINPFFREGLSGIGLVLSRQIAEGHGGSLSVRNRSDRSGCVAVLRVPIDGSLARSFAGGR